MNENSHSHSHSSSSNNLMVAFLINLVFTIIEVFGGLYTNSIAILSDAVHDLGDSISLGMSAFLERVSKKEPDEKYTFGYQRFSLLGALFSSLVLFGGTIFILTETIPRLLSPEPVDAKGMLIFSVLGIFFNGIAYYRTHGGSTLNEKSISLHLLEDLFGWVAILIGSIILFFVNWYMIDALMSIMISVFILYHVYRNINEIFCIFLQRVPKSIDIELLKTEIETIPGISKAYHIHVWSLSEEKLMMSLSILVIPSSTMDKVAEIKTVVRDYLTKYNIHHVAIECEIDKS